MSAIISEALEKLHKVGETDKTLGESIVDIIRKLNEAEMSDEDRKDSEILRGIYKKLQGKKKPTFTKKEQSVLDKYNLQADHYARDIGQGYQYPGSQWSEMQSIRPLSRKGIIYGYHADNNMTNPKVNYADRARKMKTRAEKEARYGSNINGMFYNGKTYQDRERQAYNDMLQNQSLVPEMKHALDRRKELDAKLSDEDKRLEAELKRIEDSKQVARQSSEIRKAELTDRRSDSQNVVNRILKLKGRKPKTENVTEALRRNRKKGLKEEFPSIDKIRKMVKEAMRHFNELNVNAEFDDIFLWIERNYPEELPRDFDSNGDWVRAVEDEYVKQLRNKTEALRRNSKRRLKEEFSVPQLPITASYKFAGEYAINVSNMITWLMDWFQVNNSKNNAGIQKAYQDLISRLGYVRDELDNFGSTMMYGNSTRNYYE